MGAQGASHPSFLHCTSDHIVYKASIMASFDVVLQVTKQTFIEFRLPEEDNARCLRRSRSVPSLVTIPCSSGSKCISKFLEAPTPTTCASESGDADLESLSVADESFEENI